MHYLVYVSSARHLMRDDELSAILRSSRRHNAADDITGMLLYKDGSFMQVLEGAQDAVARTFGRIERDPRHSGLIVLRQGETKMRNFSDWAMGFRALRADDLAKVPGFVQLAHGTFTDPALTANPHIAMRALKQFHEGIG